MIADGLSRIAMSTGLAASLSRATDHARARGHAEVTLEHMLLALSEDPEAGLVLAASNINLTELQEVIEEQLAALPQHGPIGENELVVAPDLRRILEAAAAAARGGRRREINGAIVLAAIIGDGKSAAADALSALGLTFEGAIRALQSKPAPPAQPEARPLPAPDAEAILAGARERVQSRTVTAPPRRAHSAEYASEHYEAEPEGHRSEQPPRPAPLPPREDESEPAAVAQARLDRQHPPPPSRPQLPMPSHPVTNNSAAYARRDDTYQHEEPAHDGGHYPDTAYENAQEEEPYQGHEFHPLPSGLEPDYDQYAPAQPDHGHVEDHGHGHDYAARPTSAPFPPPIPVPHDDTGWAPAPTVPPEEHVPARPAVAARREAQPPPFAPPPVGSAGRMPGPPPLAPWPEQEHGHADEVGGFDAHHYPPQGHAQPEHAQQARSGYPPEEWQAGGYPAPARRAEIGQLIENIPRIMRVAIPALIEVRIARADVKALAEGLQGGGAAYQHEVMVTKAMSVRLRAPDGGFYIETASPETQWIERAMLMSSEDFASWRWHVTPHGTGRRRLQLIISARTVSADGLAAETALPDQVIDVRVRTNYAQSTKRWLGWGAAAVVGGLLAKFGEGALSSFTGLLG